MVANHRAQPALCVCVCVCVCIPVIAVTPLSNATTVYTRYIYGIQIRQIRHIYRRDSSYAIEQRGDGQRLVQPLVRVKVLVVLGNEPRLEGREEDRRGNAAREASKEEHVKVGLPGKKTRRKRHTHTHTQVGNAARQAPEEKRKGRKCWAGRNSENSVCVITLSC